MDKIVYTEGCTCYGLEINDKSSKECSKEFKMELYMKLIDKLYDSDGLDNLLMDLCSWYGKGKLSVSCDGFNEKIYEYTLNT